MAETVSKDGQGIGLRLDRIVRRTSRRAIPVRGGPAIEPPLFPIAMTTNGVRTTKHIATAAILASALIVPIAYAQQDHHGANQAGGSGMSQNMGSMDKQAMHGRMEKMHRTMREIHQTDDAEERQRLMHEHMQQMHEAMGGMKSMMGANGMDQNMDVEQRQQMMQKRMDMMQQVMGQMIEQMQTQQEQAQD